MSKFCPACDETYPATATRCAADGALLLTLSSEEDLIGTTIDGRYTIRGVLGLGGMGKVYLAEHAAMDREVAVKVLHPWYARDDVAVRRFMAEARSAAQLRHPNTIRVFDFGLSPEGLLYMVLEFLQGRTLSALIADEAPLAPTRAVDLVAQVCGSLSEAHEIGIVHRDIKPENIFLQDLMGRAEHVTVLDFGVAKVASEIDATQTGSIIGTPNYMSPEQISDGATVDGRADQYAVATILYELLTGRVCFGGDRAMAVMLKHVQEPPPPLTEEEATRIPAALADVVFRALAKDRSDRFVDIASFASAATDALSAAPGAARAVPASADEASPATPFVMGRRLSQERMPRVPRETSPQLTRPHSRSAPPAQSSARVSVTGSPLRPLDIPMTHAPTGHRFRLIALGMTRGVLHCLDQIPRVGVPLSTQLEDVRLREARVSLVVIGPETGLRPEFVAVRINLIAAPTPRGLRDALAVMAPGHDGRVVDDGKPLQPGFLLALDPSTGSIGALPAQPAPPSGRQPGEHPPERVRRRPARRVIEISSRKGARPRPKRDDEQD